MASVVNTGEANWLPIRHSLEDLDRMTDYCIEHYFSQPNYWRIDGRPNFVLWNLDELVTQLGGPNAAACGLERMRERVRDAGLGGLYLTANLGCCGNNVYCLGWDRVPIAQQLGFDCVFAYNLVRTPDYPNLPEDRPIVQYEDVIKSHQFGWEKLEAGGLRHHPIVTFGCDVTPRWHRGVTLPMDYRALCYEPIVEGNTPDQFGRLCRMAIERARLADGQPKAIYINAWNEWTEGMYLLPEKRYGTGYLEALRDALKH